MKWLYRISVVFVFSLVTGCTSPNYNQMGPKLDLRALFTGELHAIGLVQNRSGAISQRFKANLTGTWSDDGVGTLFETFEYANGDTSTRTWIFTPDGKGGYVGKANDTLGEANILVAGPTINLRYQMDIDVDGSVYRVSFDDWLYAIDNNRVINRSIITKFGFRVAEVTLIIERGHIDLTF